MLFTPCYRSLFGTIRVADVPGGFRKVVPPFSPVPDLPMPGWCFLTYHPFFLSLCRVASKLNVISDLPSTLDGDLDPPVGRSRPGSI